MTFPRPSPRAVAAAIAAVVIIAAAAAPAVARQMAPGARLWAGGGAALGPAFLAATAGADWFVRPWLAGGVSAASTLPGAGDARAVEDGYGFVDALVRLRPHAPGRLRAEIAAGAGLAWIRFGAPGAHRALAPDLVLGAALGLPFGARWEAAIEATTHIALGPRAAARNAGHVSALVSAVLRFGS